VGKYCRFGQATDGNMAHVHCTLYNKGYKLTLGIYNTCCLSTSTMVARTRLKVALYVPCLSCFPLSQLTLRMCLVLTWPNSHHAGVTSPKERSTSKHQRKIPYSHPRNHLNDDHTNFPNKIFDTLIKINAPLTP
jgi:hypothetical protein